ncbi:hypothetical protein C9374_012888 [Naegleria lovaniensis]|uniref:Uncharacterized protein n=1 Tax=Naegleria lovaniensis TaxID=51637 RepID=A0AA88KHN2_NAELO|nr:uncharacterized protein C9374_012888 [Naegleria lovaniensis]KAG2373042.1 hypothetical protein C9374_012888 [Naegleria lovaniensis]
MKPPITAVEIPSINHLMSETRMTPTSVNHNNTTTPGSSSSDAISTTTGRSDSFGQGQLHQQERRSEVSVGEEDSIRSNHNPKGGLSRNLTTQGGERDVDSMRALQNRRKSTGTNDLSTLKQHGNSRSSYENDTSNEVNRYMGKRDMRRSNIPLPINFKEVDRKWKCVEDKHSTISKVYEVEGVSTTLHALQQQLDWGDAEKTNAPIPLKTRHRFWKDLSHLDDCNTRFVLIEKNSVRAEKHKKDLRKEEEQQIAVGYRFRMFGKAKVPSRIPSTNMESVSSESNPPNNLLQVSRNGMLKRKPSERVFKPIEEAPKTEAIVDMPFDICLSDYLKFVREKQPSDASPQTERSNAPSPRLSSTSNTNNIFLNDITPRGGSLLTKRKTENKSKEMKEEYTKNPNLFEMLLKLDKKSRDQIDRDFLRKQKELPMKKQRSSSIISDNIICNIPSVFQSLSTFGKLIPKDASLNESFQVSTPDEEVVKRKRLSIRNMSKKSILPTRGIDPSNPLFYIFRLRLLNYSNSEFKLLKTKFNITISQLRSHHFIDIDTFNTNLFVTLYNQSVNENGYIIPEYDDEEYIFSCSESLPWLNESTVNSLLDQHLRLTIQRCQDNNPLFDCVISFSVKERLFVVSHHLDNAPLPRHNSEKEHTSRKVKYEFLRKDKHQRALNPDSHTVMNKKTSDRKFIFVTFGEKEHPSTNRFDLNFPPTLNLVVNGMGPLKHRSELSMDSSDIFAHRKQQHAMNNSTVEIDEEDTELRNLDGWDPTTDNEHEVHVEFEEGHTSHSPENEEAEQVRNETTLESMNATAMNDESSSKMSHINNSKPLKRYFDFSQHRTQEASANTTSLLVQPQHPLIPVITQPITFYSQDTNQTILVTSTKEKNANITKIQKRMPHTSKAVIDCHEPKPLAELYHSSLDNSQKLLSEHKHIFVQQQKSGALGMIDMNMFEEIRKDAPSTDAIMIGDRKLSVALEQ